MKNILFKSWITALFIIQFIVIIISPILILGSSTAKFPAGENLVALVFLFIIFIVLDIFLVHLFKKIPSISKFKIFLLILITLLIFYLIPLGTLFSTDRCPTYIDYMPTLPGPHDSNNSDFRTDVDKLLDKLNFFFCPLVFEVH